MKPLSVLLATFGLALLATYLQDGNVTMVVMLEFTGLAYIPYERSMAQMLPAKKAWVYGTGLLEIVGGVGLLVPALCPAAGCLLVFFVLIQPGNIISARKHLDYQRGTLTRPGPG